MPGCHFRGGGVDAALPSVQIRQAVVEQRARSPANGTVARRARSYHQVLTAAKEAEWHEFILQLERTNVYDVLDRLRLRPRSVFPALVEPSSGEVAVGHLERGRVLGRAWFGEEAEELAGGGGNEGVGMGNKEEVAREVDTNDSGAPHVTPLEKMCDWIAADATDTGECNTVRRSTRPEAERTTNNKTNNVRRMGDRATVSEGDGGAEGRMGTGGSGVGSGEQEEWERGRATWRREMVDGAVIKEERGLEEVTDGEVDTAVFGCGPWKAADSHGMQMGFIHRGWPVLGDWVRHVFKASVALAREEG
ncbi:hypothetical protein C8F04DRAFT_1260256 [Mycena alexandri]|uniref:Uncharacterized protein n=1 Tax=Mycena alexandri TaxID=1745969 RepID=A0AAD6SUH2_9AGAR|nr:hypothetical protein C8F04DRAFT_1260256 [Mycena alexandri]